jgi:hypothetical protein
MKIRSREGFGTTILRHYSVYAEFSNERPRIVCGEQKANMIGSLVWTKDASAFCSLPLRSLQPESLLSTKVVHEYPQRSVQYPMRSVGRIKS